MAQCNHGGGPGKLYVVGTGPGSARHMTPAAGEALGAAEVIVGYQTYLDLIPEFLVDKEVLASQMMKEVDRCRKALDLAAQGRIVALVSGGDPGIYAMAGLVFEMAREQSVTVDIEVIAGIAALNACAARLGAPLMHDFAAISLSDLLTPWEKIERRLEAAASADFVVVIYNPKSKKRAEHIVKAREILLAHRSPETPVGIVTAATRENERIVLTTLGKMLESEIDMQTTIIVGNSMTFAWQGFMVTPRGYAAKYAL
ncbi:MAG: precorrin-3B C(17)-methyltransferase [Proteobacteria bacterium]|nr:precorrin-3B C(17)-methyltransferase [Pseudomonadota bacterium]MBU4408318.1 precorrin-3B C(17)-methyltransferase [Pseudomonadota bacterium]MBU4411786.1 precorrin-3B C(17)-methyltransferase [Pseudomonadota bacterium]PKN22692.1 MAG: precorrin-3B C(17)-methyltransferase [Deltaproteobacteria bacterium HGW-Deltaproteobacteria-3]